MEVFVATRRRRVRAVKPYNVEFLVFDPDAADEPRVMSLCLGLYIEDKAPNLAEKLTPDISKVVVDSIKVLLVDKNHARETAGQKLDRERRCQKLLELLRETGDRQKRVVFKPFPQVQFGEEVSITRRDGSEVMVGFQVLNI